VTGDSGVVAVITVMLLAVLLAVAGIVIGTGEQAIGQEQLQDGADAAALAVARSCAAGACDPGTAGSYLPGQAAVVCGSGITAACPAGCLPSAGRRHWDDVYVTQPPEPMPFGFTLPSRSACARAAWHWSGFSWLTG